MPKISISDGTRKQRVIWLSFGLAFLGNYWLWRMVNSYFILGLVGDLLAFLIFKFENDFNQKKRLIICLISLVFIGLFYFQEKPQFIFKLNDLEIYTINERRSYYPNNFLGRLLENKPVYIFSKWQKNIFESLDINNYFFASHPRERLGVFEYKKLPPIYLPVFLLGLFQLIKRKYFFIIWYSIGNVFAISAFKQVGESVFILFPWFVFVLSDGFETMFTFLITRLNYVKKQRK
jgi:hypothetical protein